MVNSRSLTSCKPSKIVIRQTHALNMTSFKILPCSKAQINFCQKLKYREDTVLVFEIRYIVFQTFFEAFVVFIDDLSLRLLAIKEATVVKFRSCKRTQFISRAVHNRRKCRSHESRKGAIFATSHGKWKKGITDHSGSKLQTHPVLSPLLSYSIS